MTHRREFLMQLASASALIPARSASPEGPTAAGALADDREYWVSVLERLTKPVLENLAERRLRERMPIESSGTRRGEYAHLEAFGRLLAGIAPWLELGADGTAEGRLRVRYAELARRGLAAATDPRSPDHMNFTRGRQPVVDAAFLAQALLRAPRSLWEPLDGNTKERVAEALRSTRVIRPVFNNWLLFSGTVEAALKSVGTDWDRMRVDYALRQHEQWYKGDGVYGDGPSFHWDYYNSFVIQPMLLDMLDAVGAEAPEWKAMQEPVIARARRYAAVLERLISPEGTLPPIGRSLAYRFGALQVLAQMALRHQLPQGVAPGQARAAMTAVIRRMTEARGTFDAAGWLTVGFAGHQPSIGESYISTGSVYLCSVGLLPLGLPPSDPFWSDPPAAWTSQKVWRGDDVPPDKAM